MTESVPWEVGKMDHNDDALDELGAKANAAFRRVANKVKATAASTHTPIIVWRDGAICEISPDDFILPDEDLSNSPEQHQFGPGKAKSVILEDNSETTPIEDDRQS